MALDPWNVTQTQSNDYTQLPGTMTDGLWKTDMSALGGDTSFLGDSFSTLNDSLGSLGKIGAIGSSLAQSYVGLKALGLAEDELDIKKDQWAMSKKELQHMQASRKRITNSYMGRSAPATSALA